MGTAQRDEYSVNRPSTSRTYLVSERLGKARSFFHSFVLNILEPGFFCKSVSSFSCNFDVFR